MGRGLIIFPGALGDLICLLPALHALRRRCRSIEFELMARAELARFAIRRMPIVAGHSIDRREVALLFSEHGGESDLCRQFFSEFDRIDCFFASDNECFCSSMRRAARGEVYFYPFRPLGPGHVAECYLREIGAATTPSLEAPIEVTSRDLREAKQRLQGLGLEPGQFALILPGSGSTKKNWAGENFAHLAERIWPICPALAVLGPAETGLAPIFQKRCLPVASDLELGELAGIARLARWYVGNDSGVSHLAAAAGTRGVVIFGPSDPEHWRPLGKVKIIQKEPLNLLTVDEVSVVAMQLIEKSTI